MKPFYYCFTCGRWLNFSESSIWKLRFVCGVVKIGTSSWSHWMAHRQDLEVGIKAAPPYKPQLPLSAPKTTYKPRLIIQKLFAYQSGAMSFRLDTCIQGLIRDPLISARYACISRTKNTL